MPGDPISNMEYNQNQANNVFDGLSNGVKAAIGQCIHAAQVVELSNLWDEFEERLSDIVSDKEAKKLVDTMKLVNPDMLFWAVDDATRDDFVDWREDFKKKMKDAYDAAEKSSWGDFFSDLFGFDSEPRLEFIEWSALGKNQQAVIDEMRPKLLEILRRAKIDLSRWTPEGIRKLQANLDAQSKPRTQPKKPTMRSKPKPTMRAAPGTG